MDFIETVLGSTSQDRQIDWLTIHPRTRSTPSTTPINLEALKLLTNKYGDRVPILVSGDVFSLGSLPYASPFTPKTSTFLPSKSSSSNQDEASQEQAEEEEEEEGKGESVVIEKMPHLPKLRGLMSARALLANPALFAGYETCPWEAVEEFMNRVAKVPLPFPLVQHHCMYCCIPSSLRTCFSSLLVSQRCFIAGGL